MLPRVPDPRERRGRRYLLVFVLAVAVACTLARAGNFREVGDHAADLPQEVLRRLGGRPHPLLRRIVAPGETRIRTLVHAIGAGFVDEVIGGWLRELADAGQLDGLLTAIAIDEKWLHGVLGGQVKLFAAMLQEEKAVIAQHRIPDDTTETTQVKELLEPVDLEDAVVTADAAHACQETAEYIVGRKQDGNGDRTTSCSKGNLARLQRAVFDAIQHGGPRPRLHGTGPQPRPHHPPLHLGHHRRRHRLPVRQPGRPDPPGPLRHRRHRRHPDQQGNRPRRHQPARRPRRSSRPGPHRPRPVGHRIGALAAFSRGRFGVA